MRLTSWLSMLAVRSTRPRRKLRRGNLEVAAIVESLETRKLLSAAPVIANVGQTPAYTEGAPPIILAPKATVTDSNNAFTSSTLTVDITNGSSGDQLGIQGGNGVGLGPNGAVMFAASQSATPIQIGTVTGGSGSTALVVNFNSHATQASVQAVLDQLSYGNGTSTLQTPDRKISFEFTDGKGAASTSVTDTVHVNPAPVISNVNPGNPVVYTEGAPPIPVAPHGQLSDAANAYNGSTLGVQVVNGQPGDQLGILAGNGVGLGPNGAVMFAASQSAKPVQIGAVTGGSGSTPLVVTFNANATQAGVQSVLNQVVYGNGTSTFQTPDRVVGVVFVDGNHVASVPTGLAIHVNPAPVIGNTGNSPVNYQVNSQPVVLASNATVADAPGAYANSSLAVQLSGGNFSDQLGIQASGGLTLGANNSLLFNGVVIGAYSGGSGNSPLVIKFNGSATQIAVQTVLDNITFSFQTTSGSPLLSNRLATFTFTDGKGVPSAKIGVGINVTK